MQFKQIVISLWCPGARQPWIIHAIRHCLDKLLYALRFLMSKYLLINITLTCNILDWCVDRQRSVNVRFSYYISNLPCNLFSGFKCSKNVHITLKINNACFVPQNIGFQLFFSKVPVNTMSQTTIPQLYFLTICRGTVSFNYN